MGRSEYSIDYVAAWEKKLPSSTFLQMSKKLSSALFRVFILPDVLLLNEDYLLS